MGRVFVMLMGGAFAIGLLLMAFYAWFEGAAWLIATDRPHTLHWATRCLAVAAAAGAQIVLLTFVARRRGSTVLSGLRVTATLVCCVAAVSAAAFAMAARD
ncbi:MAG TPA: hypothetical protein VGB55_00840 [Tepidisphaeraceae bacterium]